MLTILEDFNEELKDNLFLELNDMLSEEMRKFERFLDDSLEKARTGYTIQYIREEGTLECRENFAAVHALCLFAMRIGFLNYEEFEETTDECRERRKKAFTEFLDNLGDLEVSRRDERLGFENGRNE